MTVVENLKLYLTYLCQYLYTWECWSL